MKLMNGFYVKMMNQLTAWKKEERGSQTLEWLGIAAVIVILVGIVSQAFNDEGIGTSIKEKFDEFIENIGSGE
ncbi:hypothetical protein SAMN05216389_10983 [Oceanobacillus limi]|uniref:Pilus assembly protein Flp/PilA n=1 Tax=Oceanobacillus limi TaxID=930131 RepID=A0A1I0DPK1_9BACI|nr:hypothetical protein [Oceanobacillus limi]SET34472.1 hypothetical protein SAMN05216389_10983 [Oceanobacillus limi]